MSNSPEQPTSLIKAYFFGYLALLLISISAMVSYFAYDCIGPLTPLLKDMLNLSATQVYWLYSIYSIPVIFLVVVGGILTDKLGVKKASLLFTAIFAFGTILTASQNYTLMLIGRFLFGIGAECFYVVMNKILAKWFKNKGLALAFGVNLFLCRAGTFIAFQKLGWIASNFTLSKALWIVAVFNIIGVLTALIFTVIDRYGEKKKYVSFIEEKEEIFNLKSTFKLPLAFWVISLLCVTYYSAIFPFQACATDFFVERYNLDLEAAGKLASIIILISMCSTWLFGAVIDKIGKRATILIIGSALMIPCHISMAYTNISPWIPMIVLGLSFSLVPAALWPAIPLMIKENQVGTAFGIIGMIQNIGLFIFPIAAGSIRDNMGSYNPAMIMFSMLGVLGLIFAIWLKMVEAKGGSYLEKA